ncbi:benenodin family lasso peptide [Sphingomonas sp. BIUV-7]|uniref:Benenodin family lasso peptide n=1 Tax=Sphingomonas natans TaxID=3063330 RepID=A0ABT8YAQ9_9SPHN|nr:benenodin family lasso peptide [Sphingomonas sp. BIUV-7]MDO6415429.1 benenodin family lasso peptide [Sphingomonas sp. BIUV-7]
MKNDHANADDVLIDLGSVTSETKGPGGVNGDTAGQLGIAGLDTE